MDYEINGAFQCRNGFPSLSRRELSSLLLIASDEEIYRVIFSMALLKAPGVDDFQANFFQTQWEIVGLEVCTFVR